MPRSLVLGNGSTLICLDQHGQVRDFYFPHVGLENHTAGCTHQIGVWADGEFSWLSDAGWSTSVRYKHETLVSDIVAQNKQLGIEFACNDVVYNEHNVFLRRIKITNTKNKERDIRIFFNQQFHIGGVSHSNTAYYDPAALGVIHYRGRRVFLIGGHKNGRPFDAYSIGVFNLEGKEGTWRDAEDGVLSGNPVEHGSVDSVVSFKERVRAHGSFSCDYWIISGGSTHVVKSLQKYIHIRGVSHIFRSTSDYWWAWVNKINVNFADLDKTIVDLFKRSLLIIRTHIDNKGAIIASGDSDILQGGRDTYSYMWPRDAAFTALALDEAGYFEVTNRFFKLCHDLLGEEGYLLHKYQPDKSLGSSWHPWVYKGERQLAIQEDETALVLYALWKHYIHHRDIEFIESIYNGFIKQTADFLYFYRDENTKLPFGSYDIWEERFATFTFTASAVYAALVAAGNFAHVLGKDEDARKYQTGAVSMREAIIKTLYRHDTNFFCKSVDLRGKQPAFDCTFDMSSFYGPFKFGVLGKDDVRLHKAYETLEQQLCCRIDLRYAKIGGVLRYEGDRYQMRDSNVSGNPWFITTLWLHQYKIDQARRPRDLEAVKEDIAWVSERALPSGILSEQLDPNTGEQISVAPLIWSHAEFITTIFDYLKQYRKLQGS